MMVWLKRAYFFSQAMGVSNYGSSDMLPKYFVHCLAIEKQVTHCLLDSFKTAVSAHLGLFKTQNIYKN